LKRGRHVTSGEYWIDSLFGGHRGNLCRTRSTPESL
jgi:hypothetical protein